MLQITKYSIRLKLCLQKWARRLITTEANGWGHHNEHLPITAVRNTVDRSFSKFTLIKTFHRSTMTD